MNPHSLKAYEVIKSGGLSLVKADIGYGLLGHSRESIEKMYRIKNRPYSNPCITAGNITTLIDVATLHYPVLLDWLRQISQITTLAVVNPINPKSTLLQSLDPWVKKQATLDDSIAVFLNTGDYIEPMIEQANQEGFLLVGSSGNISSYGNNYDFSSVPNSMKEALDYSYDAGESRHQNAKKLATTIINLKNFTIKRRGVNFDVIFESYQQFAEQQELPQLKAEVTLPS